MRKKRAIAIISGILCAMLLFALAGCTQEPEPEAPSGEPETGGRISETDPDAPKEISSADITDFDASFYCATRPAGDSEGFYHFTVRTDESGRLMAAEEERGVSAAADKELLSSLQDIIDEHDLAAMNGDYDAAVGVAPEFQGSTLAVGYASGETIEFTSGGPYDEWIEDVYDVFAGWFSDKGVDSLYPEPEASTVEVFRIEYTEDGVTTKYGDIKVDEADAIDGETLLLQKDVYKADSYDQISWDFVKIPSDYYKKVTGVIAGTDLDRNYLFSQYNHESGQLDNHDIGFYGMGSLRPDYSEEDSEELELDMYIKYESGHILNIETKKASEIEGMRDLIDELIKYNDSLFDGNGQ